MKDKPSHNDGRNGTGLALKPMGRRGPVYKSPESRARSFANLIPIKPGEARNPGGRPKTKPFHDAAVILADEMIGTSKKSALIIQPTDTVATAVMKSLGAAAIGFGPQKVSAAKELADRAEGPAERVLIEDTGGLKIQSGMKDFLVRFGFSISSIAATDSTE